VYYIDFFNASITNGCNFFEQLIPAIQTLRPLLSVFSSEYAGVDFATLWMESYGILENYENLGLNLTVLNNTAAMRLSAIFAANPNVTVTVTPCKWFSLYFSQLLLPSFSSNVNHVWSCHRDFTWATAPLCASPFSGLRSFRG